MNKKISLAYAQRVTNRLTDKIAHLTTMIEEQDTKIELVEGRVKELKAERTDLELEKNGLEHILLLANDDGSTNGVKPRSAASRKQSTKHEKAVAVGALVGGAIGAALSNIATGARRNGQQKKKYGINPKLKYGTEQLLKLPDFGMSWREAIKQARESGQIEALNKGAGFVYPGHSIISWRDSVAETLDQYGKPKKKID